MKNIDLLDAILKINNKQELENFFYDLCTPKEIEALKERWKSCQFLYQGDLSYREIKKITGASLTTIGRVARFLNKGNGYKTLLKTLNESNKNDGNDEKKNNEKKNNEQCGNNEEENFERRIYAI